MIDSVNKVYNVNVFPNPYLEFDLEYETFTAKDRILVRYDNQIL
jgi:hypothetical protein